MAQQTEPLEIIRGDPPEFFLTDYPVKAVRGNRSKSKPKKQLKVLLLDLYVAWHLDPTLLTGIGLSESSYTANSRYNELHISFQLVRIVHLAVGFGLIDYHYGTEGSGKVTRIWPTEWRSAPLHFHQFLETLRRFTSDRVPLINF